MSTCGAFLERFISLYAYFYLGAGCVWVSLAGLSAFGRWLERR